MTDTEIDSHACWYVYLLECQPASIYTGIATDVAARIRKHIRGTGARYTRSHPPKRLLGMYACSSRSEAQRMESSVRKLGPEQKRCLAQQWCEVIAPVEIEGLEQ